MRRYLLLLLFVQAIGVSGQEIRDSVKVYFRQGSSGLDLSFRENRLVLDRIAERLRANHRQVPYRLLQVMVVGGASPEGGVALNRRLSEKRAGVLFDYLARHGFLPDSLRQYRFLGRDWLGLVRLAERDKGVPYREETLELLREIAKEVTSGRPSSEDPLRRLQRFRGGVPYKYMYVRLFPELRASGLYLVHVYPGRLRPLGLDTIVPITSLSPRETIQMEEREPARVKSPFYMGLKTNLLYDALAIPNAGVEFYLGWNWSVSGHWMYAWWKTDRRHWYWRTYGGDIALRKWFGRQAHDKPLTGHHIGVYGQLVTYDFETGGRGYLGDRWSYGGGLEYGYSHPIARRLNLDFTLGGGYLGGEYKKYVPEDDCYVWQATKQRHWVGPTKAEVSLVWLVGRGNYNHGKGGKK